MSKKRTAKVSKKAIRRSVASSTALETGESIEKIEEKLRTKDNKAFKVSLAK